MHTDGETGKHHRKLLPEDLNQGLINVQPAIRPVQNAIRVCMSRPTIYSIPILSYHNLPCTQPAPRRGFCPWRPLSTYWVSREQQLLQRAATDSIPECVSRLNTVALGM